MEWHLVAVTVFWVVLGIIGQRAAYRNGVVDGYGYAVEPDCPGYRLAGEHLKKTMTHRWPELKDTGCISTKDLIAGLRGGIPENCSFCFKKTHPDKMNPEEAGEWICDDCLAKNTIEEQ